MRAAVCQALGDPGEVLAVRDLPPPPLGETGVRLAVKAAGVNFADGLLCRGKYQEKAEPPFVPGFEVAGTVLEVAPGVAARRPELTPGRRVLAVLDRGGYAEQAVAAADDVQVLPEGMDFVTAAGFPIAYGTAHLALADRGRLAAGEVLVVHGAAGGVGLCAVECGKALGAEVIATAGGPDKLAAALEHGADHVIDAREEDVRERVRALTGGRGADVVFDPVGGPLFEASLRSMAPDGRLLTIGFASGEVPKVAANYLLVKNLTVTGVYWGAYRRLDPARLAASFRQLFDWYRAGRLHPRIAATFPLAEAGTALNELAARRIVGKAVILPDGEPA
ncbi:NADPH:quinone oxidoreductase family protein [Roseospirillum parvum]|uniref:NADPH2:quinone reductase n=1 Tax=Roseospirillum parvum TaxID=83401 RepID=A0A1G7WM71_9PROT|nr:NADPH:quinone oxidoreductase family protein [Roseospirillum parvum]SDG73097.1 NADPH2:quinone reductase [Roseospirillum parvum]